jgi:acylphosphatase
MQQAHIWISGRVQGVGFRYFTAGQARRLGVRGSVRNLPDGRVEVVAEGDRAAIEALLAAVRQGPPGAHVRDVRVDWTSAPDREPPGVGAREFTIK